MALMRRGRGSVDDAIFAHYKRALPDRQGSSVHWTPDHISNRLPYLHMASFSPVQRGGFWIFATIGAWRATEPQKAGLEFVAVARAEDAGAVAGELGKLAYYHAGPPENRLGVGHTLSIGGPWVPGSPLDAVLISLPYPWGPELEHCQVGDRHIQVLWVIPIYELERVYKREQGLEALEQLFSQGPLDYLNPFRQSLV